MMMNGDTSISYSLPKTKIARIRTRLQFGYQINDNDVFCGRGVLCSSHVGNHRFRSIINDNLDRYNASDTKSKKTLIIYEIIDYIRAMSPSGGFVTKDSDAIGCWYEVGDLVARQKTSQAFRDAMVGRCNSRLFNNIATAPKRVVNGNTSQKLMSRHIHDILPTTNSNIQFSNLTSHNPLQLPPKIGATDVAGMTGTIVLPISLSKLECKSCFEVDIKSSCEQQNVNNSPTSNPSYIQTTNVLVPPSDPPPIPVVNNVDDTMTFDLLLQFCENKQLEDNSKY